MKKILFALGWVLVVGTVYADCATSGITWSCEAGYYLRGTKCLPCSASNGVQGTTVDKNTGDIASCYIPSDTSFSDDSGAGVYMGDCYYTN